MGGEKVPAYYPVFLDVRGRRCIVIGGGDHGQEKAERLVDYGADVVVVSPDATDAVRAMAADGRLSWIRRRYRHGDLEGAFIAIVADTSDPTTNREVSAEARDRNVPLNVMDVPDLCTWIAPAVARRGDVVVAASTGGSSPALARRIREELQGDARRRSKHPIMALAGIAPLLSRARRTLRLEGISIDGDHWQASLDDDLVDLVEAGRSEEAEAVLMARLRVGDGCGCQQGVCKMWDERAPASDGRAGPLGSAHLETRGP
jgi:precorrin-2 dehydrogenase/sirohydrochlorin ferrochelatase